MDKWLRLLLGEGGGVFECFPTFQVDNLEGWRKAPNRLMNFLKHESCRERRRLGKTPTFQVVDLEGRC